MTEPENQLSVIPPPLEGDDDDVAWALQTASVQWKRGARADAIVWLRRAVDSAMELGQLARAQQINQTILAVEELIVQTVFGRPPTEPPAAGSPEIDALIGLPPAGRASIDIEFDDQIAFDDREESTTVMEQPELPAEPTEGAFPPPWEQHAPPPPPPPVPAFPPSEPPPEQKFPPSAPPEPVVREKKVRRVRPPPPPSAMPKAPSVAPEADIPPPPPQMYVQSPVPDIRDSRSDLEPTIRTQQPPSSVPPAPLPPISYSVLEPEQPHHEQVTVTQPLASPGPLPARSEPSSDTDRPRASEPAPPPEPAEPEPGDDEPRIKGVKLADVAGLQDLPPEAQTELVRSARLETLDVDEEVSSFGIALVIEGWASVMPEIADAACAFAQPGAVVFTQGTLETSVALRIVAGETDTVVAVWERDALEKATADCPWVADELRAVADRFQALAGAAMGPLGERLDDTLRQSVTDRCEVRTYAAGDFVVEEGDPVPGLFVVGAGEVELLGPDGSVTQALGPGEFLFASEVMGGAPAAATVRAGESGAVMLLLSRHTAHELMVSVPPLLEILAG